MTYSEKKYRQKVSLGQSGNVLTLLIAIHLVIFIILAFIKLIFRFQYADGGAAVSAFNNNMLSWFILPADTGKMLSRPWTIITHMFVHTGIWQVLANMLWLWCFGYIMQDLTGNKKIITANFDP